MTICNCPCLIYFIKIILTSISHGNYEEKNKNKTKSIYMLTNWTVCHDIQSTKSWYYIFHWYKWDTVPNAHMSIAFSSAYRWIRPDTNISDSNNDEDQSIKKIAVNTVRLISSIGRASVYTSIGWGFKSWLGRKRFSLLLMAGVKTKSLSLYHIQLFFFNIHS